MGFWTGEEEKFGQRSTLGKEQQGLYQQMLRALQGQGGGGAFGQSADYYRSLFDEDNDTFNSLANPEQRRFREQTIPDLAEQFAGMGSGGLSSSGFRNATVNAGTDLAERLASMRAGLRQQGAQGLSGLGQFGLGQFNENYYTPRTPGFLENLGGMIGGVGGQAASAYFGGPAAAIAQGGSSFGKSSPYGNANPGVGGNTSRSGLPTFMGR